MNMQVCVGVRTPRIHPLSMLCWAGESPGGRDAGRRRTMTPSCSSPLVWVGGIYSQFSPRKDPPSHPRILEMPTCPGTLSPHLSSSGRDSGSC
ncbi:glucose-6-phosphate 1-dehydrogenase-like isoform X2 [Clarias magur]|uniref:Glucose-6-phosphate 1-dehydrogenase-like isoform X2 n=1 Tax=Clarias magur TaxID=1594786 RepID=A0A8J4U9D2_CLAMG|nr:glucose-6-phosphate 1-dehydrogenase-like isoform X2 [Clarias magur]